MFLKEAQNDQKQTINKEREVKRDYKEVENDPKETEDKLGVQFFLCIPDLVHRNVRTAFLRWLRPIMCSCIKS